jgi:hypothetical protein
MRSVKHSLHGVAVVAFYGSFILACAASSVYRKLTPDMYVIRVLLLLVCEIKTSMTGTLMQAMLDTDILCS